ncbi:Os04g0570125 [Oryza sativa Japonica Group]|uniref:Os04g0570125 protein n=1 Tax=Oryza sativa subsp. japonica TaxID=39947 RepID=A0A0P0WDP1_ORYSJ|nr:hypothetical protein EE612_025014 [Oryza sativa]BAS90564.1 Os04g0570125 [Oryza sativa Japonica Group]
MIASRLTLSASTTLGFSVRSLTPMVSASAVVSKLAKRRTNMRSSAMVSVSSGFSLLSSWITWSKKSSHGRSGSAILSFIMPLSTFIAFFLPCMHS